MASYVGQPVVVGQGDYQYQVATDWFELPDGWSFVEATSVAADRRGRAFVFNRGQHPVIVLDRNGQVETHWGAGNFVRAHGITITSDDEVWLVDDCDHTVQKYTLDGHHQLTLGTSGQPSDTGATSIDYRTIQRAGPPFHYPTNLAVAPSGELYVADGYGNARIHRFTAAGELLQSWGTPGSGPGQFHVPHGIGVDSNGVVFVADRENSRLQRFDPDGRFLDEWTDVARPCQVFLDDDDLVYVAELGYRAGRWPGTKPPAPDATGGRVSILSPDGDLLARWGGGQHPGTPGDFFAPHDIWVDGEGTVYVAEVSWSAGGKSKVVPPDIPSLHQFKPQTTNDK